MEQKYSIWQQHKWSGSLKQQNMKTQIKVPQNCIFTQVQYLSKCTKLQSIPGLLDVGFLM